eukprot:scaffold2192_cov268-Chaetoceros_neogracile.AAC.83
MEQPRKPQDELHRILTCARLNRTTGPLSPHRFEACAHHQTGSCTPFQRKNVQLSTDTIPTTMMLFKLKNVVDHRPTHLPMHGTFPEGAIPNLRSDKLNPLTLV